VNWHQAFEPFLHGLAATTEESANSRPRPVIASGETDDTLFDPRQFIVDKAVIGDQRSPRVVTQQILDNDVELLAYVHAAIVRNGCRTDLAACRPKTVPSPQLSAGTCISGRLTTAVDTVST
jgi:hypothetical protein